MNTIPAIEKEYGYILTYSGKRFYPDFPENLEADIIDIAHALSNVCRYNGHLKSFYSVAQHSVLVSRYVRNMWPELALAALLHDASEAYLPDMPSPIKANLPDFKLLENKVHEQIFKQFKLKWPYPALIKEIDKRIRVDEMKYMQEWGEEIDGKEGLGILITPWGPSIAEELFLEEYATLTGASPNNKVK